MTTYDHDPHADDERSAPESNLMTLAHTSTRFWAHFIDSIFITLIGGAGFLLVYGIYAALGKDLTSDDDVLLALVVLAAIAYVAYEMVLLRVRGRTIGMSAMGIRVTTSYVRMINPSWDQSIRRWLVKYGEPVLLIVSLLLVDIETIGTFIWHLALLYSMQSNRYRQGWHDRVAKTYVAVQPPKTVTA